jgi:hypothetical protein
MMTLDSPRETSPTSPPVKQRRWIAGTILIALGGVFLLQNAGVPLLRDNWWALFILIPAFAAFSAAWSAYQEAGEVTSTVGGLVIGGSVPLVIALVFLFGLDFGQWWPLLLIGAGLGLFFGAGRHARQTT